MSNNSSEIAAQEDLLNETREPFGPLSGQQLQTLATTLLLAFGTKRKAKEWLMEENKSLRNTRPATVLLRDGGYTRVMELLYGMLR